MPGHQGDSMQPQAEVIEEPRSSRDAPSIPSQQSNSALHGLPALARARWPEWATIAFFAALVAFAIPYHEPWSDEAQAWQLARSLSLHDLFQTYIRYEGSPGLWHFFLWVLIRAHVSYSGLHWICGAIAVAATSLLVLKSPFPRYLKLTLPFTFFLLFQYAVVARSYVLVPALLYLIALEWKKRPLVLALLLGLLSNVALHASVISVGLAVVYFAEKIRNGALKDPRRRSQLLLFSFILLCFFAFALWTAWPPQDISNHIASVRGQSRPFVTMALGSLCLAICQPWVLAIPFWIAIALCLRARRGLIYLLPVVLFVAFCGAVHAHLFHMGLLVPLVICILWITWPASGCGRSRSETAGRVALGFMVGVQILWSAYALGYDHFNAYSPAPATAEFLKPFVRNGDTIAVTYLSQVDSQDYEAVAMLPYFDHNIYANQQQPFWWWGNRDSTEDRFYALLPSHPRIVLVHARPKPGQPIDLNDPKAHLLFQSGYRFTNQFCGTIPARLGAFGDPLCFMVFQPVDSSRQPSKTRVDHVPQGR
jgi:hypothetical protein